MRIDSNYPVSPGHHTGDPRKTRQREGVEGNEARVNTGREQNVASKAGQGALTEEDKKELAELKKRDREVKQHEMAHMAAAAGLAVSGAQFEYKRGPDGVMYAVGGEVSIDTSPVAGDPKATLAKAQKIERAAMAPVDPSPQDYKVAAQARQMASQARLEMMRESQGDVMDSSAASASASESEPQGRFVDIQA